MFILFKHLHSTIALTITLFFIIRFVLRLTNSALLKSKIIKILAIVLDTSLLVFALITYFLSSYAFPVWLILKVVLLISYIYFAFYCLKRAQNSTSIFTTGIIALLSLIGALGLAYSKPMLF